MKNSKQYQVIVDAVKIDTHKTIVINGHVCTVRPGEYLVAIPGTDPLVNYIVEASSFSKVHKEVKPGDVAEVPTIGAPAKSIGKVHEEFVRGRNPELFGKAPTIK